MLEASDALQRILAQSHRLPPERVPLAAALGRVLAEAVRSDLDMPPFDKSLMDGYAVRSSDGDSPRLVIEEVTAGQVPTKPVGPGQTTRVMTGAPIPEGADAVIPHEVVRLEGNVARPTSAPKAGSFLIRKASEYRAGDELLQAGTVLRPQEIGTLAAVGQSSIQAVALPRVAIMATGDELVEPPTVPGPGQLRNSNAPMLTALAQRLPALPRYLGIGRDTVDSLAGLVREGLTCDALVLAGGVSAGKLDLVPSVLESAGVRAHFHHVNIKPGKPLLFGTGPQGQLVFGLPGNPVSAFVTFELFVRPALRKLAGFLSLQLPSRRLALSALLSNRSDRPTYHPAALEGTQVRAVPWRASADLASLLGANALIVLPAGEVSLPAGEMVETLALDG
jgi:molybdopterin molybdotransferase